MKYEDILNTEEEALSAASEQVPARNLLLLRNRVVDLVNQTTDEEDLYECLSVLEKHAEGSERSDVSRAITGDEVMNRLRPRLKELFS